MAGESITILEGPAAGTRIELGTELLIGRSATGEGSLGCDPELSRRHARIYEDRGSYVLEDLGSTNGTYLNGWRIPSSQILSSGDKIQVGGTLMTLELPAADTAAARTAVRATPAGAETS